MSAPVSRTRAPVMGGTTSPRSLRCPRTLAALRAPCQTRQPLGARRSSRRLAVAVSALGTQLEPDNASVLVAGGGGIALDVTRKLKDAGAWVWMLQRSHSRAAEIEGMMALIIKGDAMNPEQVQAAFDQIEEVDAVVTTIGGTPADASADSEGNINLIKAAMKKGVKRFVLVTSIGTGNSKDAPPQQVYDVLEKVLVQKGKAEDFLINESGLEYTIIRPGGLKSEPATGQGVLTEDNTVCGAVYREDVAQLVVKALLSPKAAYKVLSAVDRTQMMGDPQFEDFQL
eukprot:CAMPEP_0206139950 /NCGR_PEP_ID=MMETSP1473-20131121/7823_1 /ASSEMBLY_ACC=CAM_ASM_001109 /TAXON_ID=1461547 /ORGANISM="Stichococcus sp, Strain RCC1054" /LENGTH=284 /DNA_ID=CAMNT_0053533905 /DNA_START=174 /DNA_END=1028 /DNA_ORIENTATION=+